MKTRILHTKLWKDGWFVSLSRDAKLLWLYLLSSENINISGVYELSDREIVFDTSIPMERLPELKKELHPKAIFYKGWVRVQNVERYNSYRNSPKNETAYLRELSYVPKDIGEKLGLGSYTSIDTSIYTTHKSKSEIINKKSKSEIKGTTISKRPPSFKEIMASRKNKNGADVNI